MPVLGCGAEIGKLMDVSDQDVASIEEVIAERLALGVSQAVAQRQAVDEVLAQLADERSMVMKAVQDQLGFPEKANEVEVSEESVAEPESAAAPVMANKPQTDTPAFRKWFGDSKVVDADGKPLVVYRGQPSEHNDYTLLDRYYTSDKRYAGEYSADQDGANVLPVYIVMRNPYFSDERNDVTDWDFWRRRDDLIAQGYDGIATSDRETWFPFDTTKTTEQVNQENLKPSSRLPTTLSKRSLEEIGDAAPIQDARIKSAIGNNGNFDGTNPDIRFANKANTDTPEFKRFFKDSKVVDAYGAPLVVYHGTVVRPDTDKVKNMGDITAFDRMFTTQFRSPSLDTVGSWFSTNPGEGGAEMYSGKGSGSAIYPVYLSIKNPQVTTFQLMARRARLLANGVDDGRRIGTLEVDAYRKWLESMGKDGIKIEGSGNDGSTEFDNQTAWIALYPEQIKSATGNNGQFDPENPDIRFANKANTGSLWDAPPDTKADLVIQKLQDGRIDLKRVQDAIAEKTKKPLDDAFDARLSETLYAGRVATRANNFLKIEAQPLLEAMAKNNASMDELSDYLLARHAPEANAQIAKQGEILDGGAGSNSKGVLMTTAAANAYIANLSPGKRALMQMLAKKVDELTQGTRDLLLSEGLASAEEIKNWQGAYKYYVPLFKEDALEIDGSMHPQGSGFSVTGSASKRRMGGKGEVTNMLAHVLMQREAAITRAEKNKVAMSLYALALTQPNPDFWTTIKPNMDSATLTASLQAMGVDPGAATDMDLAPTIRTISKTTGLVSTRPNPRYKQMDNAIVVKVDGQDRVIVFNKNDPRAARLVANLKNLDGAGMELAQKTIGVGTRFVASLATQYNPAFGPANAVRDTLGALVNLSSTAIAGKQLQVFAGIAAAAKGIYSEQTGGQGGKWTDLYKEFMLEGGQTGFREALKTADDRSKQIEKELGALASQGKLTTGKVLMALPKMVDGMNNIFENMVRLSAYKVALDNGQTKPQAARIARELTVDFNRKGAWAPGVGAFYAFFNASVQGNARTLATLMGKHGGKIVAGGIALGVMNAVMLAAAGFDDDEISEFAKTKAFIIPTGGKKFVSIPLPLGLHVLPNFGRVMTELYNSGGEDATAKVWGAFGEIAGSLNPFGGANPFTATGIVKMITPTVFDPVGDLARGKDFADNPINKLDSQSRDRDPRPGYLLARESTMRLASGEVYKGIAEAINYATGGREFSKGSMSPTPEEVRYGIMAVGGGLLREIEKATNASLAPARGEKVKAHQIPLLGKFVGEVDDDTVQKTRFYKYSSKIQALEAELKAKAGKGDNLEPFMKDNPLSMLYPLNDTVNAELSKLNKAVGQSLADKDALKVLDAARLEYMRALNTQVRALEKASDKMTKAAEINASVAEPDPEPEEELTE